MEKNGVKETVTINAAAAKCFAVVTDYANYPKWLPEFKSAEIVKRESDTVVQVEFAFSILLKKIRYTIRAEQWPDELRTHWTFVCGEMIDDTWGGWKFTALAEQRCQVDYEAGISVNIPISKGIANKVANLLTGTTLPRTFQALEKRARSL